ncbi:regulator of nonsense transcripts 2 isoform X3 [Octopus sinensis]|uniref:Regulator of nonsense transcripts 2 n=2 Tax=Octopus sinensis TaxID=2607531 RepID=A0A7E6FMN4_9MOLL|nr:regulator of nonsense transcripts 2 isoform X3 [Octopus sinensis]
MSSCKEESESCLSLCAANGHEDAEQFDRISSSQTPAVSSTTCAEVAIHPNKSKSPKMSPSSSSSSSSDAAVLQRTTIADVMTKSKDFETFHLAPGKKADSKYYKEESAETTKEKNRNSSKKASKESGKPYSGKEGVKCNDPDGKNNHYKTSVIGDKKDVKSKEKSDRKGNKGFLNFFRGVGSLTSAAYSPLKAGKEPRGVEMKSAAELEALWQKEEEEKRKLEEEKKKQEEEIRLQEELLRKKKEAEEAQIQEELRTIQDYIQEVKERLDQKNYLRGKNLNAAENRPDETFFSKLDSNLRRNTAFVRKLRNLTESLKDSLTKDIQSLNLSKYIGEAAAALTEAKLKMSDINCAVLICSLLHQRYADFSSCLMENWQKYLLCKKEERIANLSKYRVDLRFFAELVSVGLFSEKEGLHVLANQLSILVNSDKEEHNNLSIISSFCKHCGDDYVGIVPRKYRILAEKHNLEIERSNMLPPERQKACRNLLKEYYATLCKHLKKLHKDLKTIEQQNRKILQTKGELSNERKENYETAIVNYQKLQQNTYTLADLLDEEIPDLPEEELKQDSEGAMFDIFNPIKNAEFHYEGDTSLFEDEDTRTFYESLPDLRSLIPGILYKESEHASSKDETKEDVTALEEDIETLKIEDIDTEMEFEQKELPVETLVKDKDDNKERLKDDDIEEELDMIHQPDIEEEGDTGHLMKAQFDTFLQSLPNCVNRELIDKNAVDFCMSFNTKTNRKKLVRALFTVHRTRYDLLPFYSRLVATLYPCMPDVANDLVHLLKGDFRWHIRKKDQINIESKLKTVRFIGELVKFKMFPKTETLFCLKNLLVDFTHHNIEMACALLETCGRYLYRQMDSHHRTKVYLDVVMRKKAALHLDSRYITMIENAYYYSNPPEVPQMVKKIRPPMHEYIRKLLYKDLSKVTTEKVLRQMRKLDWDNPEVAFYATKCLTAVWNIRYNSIHCAANLLAGLAPYHELVAIQVVDGILEDIRIGMEINHPKYNQRRVSAIKYLGELYNYRMVESSVIFKVLYSFISFGISLEDNVPSALDLPDHLFRIRLVCVLLDTCGQYFDKGSSKKKLDYFLVYFQRYYWFKKKLPLWTEDHPFPVDVDNLVRDTIEAVRPKLKLLESEEDAYKAVEDLEKEIKAKIAEVLPIIDTYDEMETNGLEECGFSTIIESDEELSQNLSQVNNDENLIESETSQDDPSQSRTGSQVNDGEDYANSVHSEEDEEEDLLESAGEDETEDQVTVLTGGPKHIKCTEDEDFLSAFDRMMADNLQARSQESLKVPQLDIAVPMHLRGQVRKQFTFPQNNIEHNDTIKFVLMTKKGNKQQYTNLNVPISTEFAAKFKERERAERAEKEQMKQVVLGIHERQEEEDYQEMLAALNRPAPVNTNRERRVRYQHPKGAPDADLIFGSKER